MNGYPYGGYYGQPMAHMYPPHGPPMMHPQQQPGYPPFYQPHPSQNMPPGPVPMSYDADAYVQEYQNASGQSKKKSRRQSAPTSSAAQPPPLKSAMKKTASAMATPMPSNNLDFPVFPYGSGNNTSAGYPLSRQRTNSMGRSNPERRRTLSNAAHSQDHSLDPPFLPLHMFVSFAGYNELHLENITELALVEIRDRILPIWEDGIEAQSQVMSGGDVVVKFRNNPWDMSGPNVLMALKLVQQLFILCSQRGYAYKTTINLGQANPRLVFSVHAPNLLDHYFVAYFSSSGRRLTLVNPPSHVDLSVGAQLKAALPRKITTDHVEQSNLRIIEVKRKPGQSGPEVEYSLFLAHFLKILDSLGFELIASVPFYKKQSLGMKQPQEVLVFKGGLPSG